MGALGLVTRDCEPLFSRLLCEDTLPWGHLHPLQPGDLDLEHGTREALQTHFLPCGFTDGRNIKPSEEGPPRPCWLRPPPVTRTAGDKEVDGGGDPPVGGLWPVTPLLSTYCVPGPLPELQARQREDTETRHGGRRERLGESVSADPAVFVTWSPSAAAPSGCHVRHGISSGGAGHFHSPVFAPDTVSGTSQGRRPG